MVNPSRLEATLEYEFAASHLPHWLIISSLIPLLQQVYETLHVMCVLSHFSHVQLFATPWTVARQAPLSMRFFRQE